MEDEYEDEYLEADEADESDEADDADDYDDYDDYGDDGDDGGDGGDGDGPSAEDFEPLVIAFCCNWCSYAGADLAGTSRLQYPPNVRIIRVMCSGMIHPNLVINALSKGADGVIICGCHPGDCHYLEGNLKAQSRAGAIELLLEDLGLEPERFRLEWVSASEGPRFAQLMTQMVEQVKGLGPNPYRT